MDIQGLEGTTADKQAQKIGLKQMQDINGWMSYDGTLMSGSGHKGPRASLGRPALSSLSRSPIRNANNKIMFDDDEILGAQSK